MLVEICKQTKQESIGYFEALCSFWRTLYQMIIKNEGIRNKAHKMIEDFISDEKQRHKDVIPDVGVLLALFTTVKDKFDTTKFIDAYIDESFLRKVMWWQQDIMYPDQHNVFKATEVGRKLLMSQILLMETIIGEDLINTATEMDNSYGKLEKKLEKFQQSYKNIEI